MGTTTELARELAGIIGDDAVRDDPQTIVRMLRDNSWLSPVLTDQAADRANADGETLGVLAVAMPKTEADVINICKFAAKHRIPVTPRGCGTSNFGLITPERGGLILDMRGLRGEPTLEGTGMRAPAGTLHGKMEEAALAEGRELALLTTTYATATAAGWVVGGHVGLGSSVHGSVWDDIVQELRVVTAEETPRVLTLRGDETFPLLHTFGAFGVITEVVLRTEPAHEWLEAIAFFPDFEQAADFTTAMSTDTHFAHRVVSAQEEPVMSAFTPLGPILRPGSGVLMIIDKTQVAEVADLARSHGGDLIEWQQWTLSRNARPSIAAMVYGHRMLWVKRAFPDAAFLHVYFHPETVRQAMAQMREAFGSKVILEMKYVRSPWMAGQLGFDPTKPVPAAVITICDGADPHMLEAVMRYCEENDVPYQNPHTGVVEDNGLIGDLGRLEQFKQDVDPFNLLNPGKVRAADDWNSPATTD